MDGPWSSVKISGEKWGIVETFPRLEQPAKAGGKTRSTVAYGSIRGVAGISGRLWLLLVHDNNLLHCAHLGHAAE